MLAPYGGLRSPSRNPYGLRGRRADPNFHDGYAGRQQLPARAPMAPRKGSSRLPPRRRDIHPAEVAPAGIVHVAAHRAAGSGTFGQNHTNLGRADLNPDAFPRFLARCPSAHKRRGRLLSIQRKRSGCDGKWEQRQCLWRCFGKRQTRALFQFIRF